MLTIQIVVSDLILIWSSRYKSLVYGVQLDLLFFLWLTSVFSKPFIFFYFCALKLHFNKYSKIALKITILLESPWKFISFAPEIFFLSKLIWFYFQNCEAADTSSEYYVIF